MQQTPETRGRLQADCDYFTSVFRSFSKRVSDFTPTALELDPESVIQAGSHDFHWETQIISMLARPSVVGDNPPVHVFQGYHDSFPREPGRGLGTSIGSQLGIYWWTTYAIHGIRVTQRLTKKSSTLRTLKDENCEEVGSPTMQGHGTAMLTMLALRNGT